MSAPGQSLHIERMRILPLVAVTLAFTSPLAAQTVQYRSPEGVEYRSLADTGPVARAKAALDADPRNIQRFLDLGAAQAAARQMREAVETYTQALAVDSTNAMLYRWRGHRRLSVRLYREGWQDLTKALQLDSTNYGALYHIGVVRFVTGEFRNAALHFARGLLNPPNAAETAGSTDWLWMSLSRAGLHDQAAELLSHRPDSVPVNNAYATRLRLYRGLITPADVFTIADTADVQVATLAYGLGNWFLLRGDTAAAIQQFERAVRSGGWPAFGFMAAESELRRLRARGAGSDAAFAGVQARGQQVMGVDQYTSKHVFEDLPDGGRVVLQRDDAKDTADIRAIRAHMRDIETAFRAGDFNKPFQVHAMEVPGTKVMAEMRDLITYTMSELPRGAQLRLRTSHPRALEAIRQFLAFQRSDHRAHH